MHVFDPNNDELVLQSNSLLCWHISHDSLLNLMTNIVSRFTTSSYYIKSNFSEKHLIYHSCTRNTKTTTSTTTTTRGKTLNQLFNIQISCKTFSPLLTYIFSVPFILILATVCYCFCLTSACFLENTQ